MKRVFPAAAVAAALLLAAAPARATSSVTSTLHGLVFALDDLDPDDGVAPSLVLDPRAHSTAFAGAGTGFGNVVASWSQQGGSAFGAASASGDLDGSGGAASFAGDPQAGGAQLVASAMAGPSLLLGLASALVSNPEQGGFVLSAHTRVALFGATTIDWSASSPDAAAFGEIDLALWLVTNDGGSDELSQSYATAGYYGLGDGPLAGSVPYGVAVDLENDSDQSVVVGYEADVFAQAGEMLSVPPPVDEPSGAGLLVAGTAALLAAARRRLNGGSGACR